DDLSHQEGGLARSLYAALFGEAEKAGLLDPGRYRRLVLVGDGPLLELPWAALVDANGERLVERMPIAVAVSLGVLNWPEPPLHAAGSLLCAADPPVPGAPALPAARLEGKAVASLFPGSTLLIGEAATKRRVLTDLPKYSLLHFATHGALDDQQGLNSGVAL